MDKAETFKQGDLVSIKLEILEDCEHTYRVKYPNGQTSYWNKLALIPSEPTERVGKGFVELYDRYGKGWTVKPGRIWAAGLHKTLLTESEKTICETFQDGAFQLSNLIWNNKRPEYNSLIQELTLVSEPTEPPVAGESEILTEENEALMAKFSANNCLHSFAGTSAERKECANWAHRAYRTLLSAKERLEGKIYDLECRLGEGLGRKLLDEAAAEIAALKEKLAEPKPSELTEDEKVLAGRATDVACAKIIGDKEYHWFGPKGNWDSDAEMCRDIADSIIQSIKDGRAG